MPPTTPAAMLNQFLLQAPDSLSLTNGKSLPPPTFYTARMALPGNTINLVFGILMAILGLITIYQTARLAALHHRNIQHRNITDVEMPNARGAEVDVNSNSASAPASDGVLSPPTA